MKNVNAFEVEKIRSNMAANMRILELIATYSEEFPEIEDNNTQKLWDKLNANTKDYEFKINPMAKDRVKRVAQLVSNQKVNVLNVGFGSGSLETEFFKLKSNKVDWFGVDISKKSVGMASRNFPGAKFSVGDITRLKFKDEVFDYVLSLEVLEHIRPRMTFKALHELHRVLKKGGNLIVSVPLNEGLEEMVRRGENPNAHVRVYTPELIKAELYISDFQILNEYFLYAFNKSYKLKSFIVQRIKGLRRPNNIIIHARKL